MTALNEELICSNCGEKLPPESMFCPYCGEKVVVEKAANAPKGIEKDNSLIVNVEDDEAEKLFVPTKPKKWKVILPWILCVTLAVCLVGGYLYYNNANQNLTLAYEELIKENAALSDSVGKLEATNKEQRDKLKELRKKDSSNELVKRTLRDNYKYLHGFSDYYASEYVVVVKKNEKKKINVTCSHSGAFTIWASKGTWSKTWNGNTTSITLEGSSSLGAYPVKFTNSYNSEEFHIVVITIDD